MPMSHRILGCALSAALAVLLPPAAMAQGGGAPSISRDSLFRLVAGQWDWAAGDSTCTSSSLHSLEFPAPGEEMVLTNLKPATDTGQRVYRYRIVGTGEGLLDGFPNVIRGAMQGETRRTADSALVAWDLVLVTPDQYRWHRTDWPAGGGTKAVVRCRGGAPVNRWDAELPNTRQPIFRYTTIERDSIVLGSRWPGATRLGFTEADTLALLPPGSFGGAEAIRVHRDSSGIVRQLDFVYGSERDMVALQASYAAELGAPETREFDSNGVLNVVSGWRDPRTELVMIRFVPLVNGVRGVVVLTDRVIAPPPPAAPR